MRRALLEIEMQIPAWPQADEKEAELLAQVLASPQWGGFHPLVQQFEQSFAAYCHAGHAISAMNGTVTLELALELLGVGPGDEIILPAISFFSSASAISRRGAVPVFVDIEEHSFNLDPQRLGAALTAQTKAVMAVHFGGVMCQMDAMGEFCRENHLTLIEDAAHAHGSEWNGKRAGSFGRAGSFSFQNGKVMTAGEGGALVTSDDDFAEQARSIANCGRKAGRSFYEHHRTATNYRLGALQAAVLICQLERLPQQIERRSLNACLLKKLLRDVDALRWQTQPSQQTSNSHYLLTARLNGTGLTAQELCSRLQTQGIPCSTFYPSTLYQNPAYEREKCRVMPCPVAEERTSDSFWLSHRALLSTPETVAEIAKAMRDALSA